MKKYIRKRLALMLANLKKKKPYYCEVEYLKSTGTQYIDTGIQGSSSVKMGVVCFPTKNNAAVIGCGSDMNSTDRFQIFVDTPSYYSCRIDGTRVISTVAWNTKATIVLDVPNKKYTINGIEFSIPYTGSISNRTLWLFGRNVPNDGDYMYFGSIYKCQIWNNNVLVRDFIPVLDWDMRPAMYDKVSGQLFYNKGTGEFTAGRQIHPVEYLESDGNQYIDTGVLANGSFIAKYKMRVNSVTSASDIVAGARSSTQHLNFGQVQPDTKFTNGYLNTYWSTGTVRTNNDYEIEIYYKSGEQYCIIDGVRGTTRTNTGTEKLDLNVYIFKRNHYATDNVGGLNGRFYYFQLWNNDVLVRDFVPAIDENGVGFMFDNVSRAIFDNKGTGAFKYPLVELEYLESTGTQYIDTGIKCSDISLAELEAKGVIPDSAVFGGGTDNNSDDRLQVYTSSTGSVYSARMGNKNVYSTVPLTSRCKFMLDTVNKTITFNDDVFDVPYTNTITDKVAWLFARNTASHQQHFTGQIYYCKIYTNGTLVRDFVPVFQDGEAGMFDKVNKVFYKSIGSGSFIGGNIVESEHE